MRELLLTVLPARAQHFGSSTLAHQHVIARLDITKQHPQLNYAPLVIQLARPVVDQLQTSVQTAIQQKNDNQIQQAVLALMATTPMQAMYVESAIPHVLPVVHSKLAHLVK